VAVDIEIFGQLSLHKPRRQSMEIQSPATARDLARAVGLDLDEIELVTIDGVQSGLEDQVRPDSRLCFFPYVTGG
jgi:hypothetical protein